MIKKISSVTKSVCLFVAATALAGAGLRVHADTANLVSSQDVTIYDTNDNFSNAAGQFCFVGTNASGLIRRTLLRFDVSSIPAGSTVTAVTMTLNMSMSNAGATDVTAHRVLASWGEGTSLPGGNGGEGAEPTRNDATWDHRFFSTMLWTNQGGDFNATPSATTSVNSTGNYNWSSAQLLSDVQQWVNNPSTNFGWIMRGDEDGSGTAKRFGTRENTNEAVRPKLVVTYTPPPPACDADLNNDDSVGVPDLLFIINNWGACANPNDCPADIAPPGPPIGDDTVGVPDLLSVINNWGPCP